MCAPQIVNTVKSANAEEQVGDRWSWYGGSGGVISTSHASFHYQGTCSPAAAIDSPLYYPSCTSSNNAVSDGGLINPSPDTLPHLYSRASSIAPLLKPLYESHVDVKNFGVFFKNAGAGAHVVFPGQPMDSTIEDYTSAGCAWMATPNPTLDGSPPPIGTAADISRCHAAGTAVPQREYNPMERSWCSSQALEPDKTHSVGPYLDAWSADNLWLMTFGRAIYDRLTDEFIGCTLADVSIEQIVALLSEVSIGETSNTALIRNDDTGLVVAASTWDPST